MNEIYDITPLTMLDYPDNLACIVWFPGCSMRCRYCYNPRIVNAREGKRSFDDVTAFLKKRQGLLDAVVMSGGECTGSGRLIELCETGRELGFKIKIDTNGTNPAVLQRIIGQGLADYIALDYKAPRSKFAAVTGITDFDAFEASLDLLIDSAVKFEVRTTYHSQLLDAADIEEMAADLNQRGYRGTFYIQRFVGETPTIGNLPPDSARLNITDLPSPLRLEIR